MSKKHDNNYYKTGSVSVTSESDDDEQFYSDTLEPPSAVQRDMSLLSADFDTLFEIARERRGTLEESEDMDHHSLLDRKRSSSGKSSLSKRDYLRKQKALHHSTQYAGSSDSLTDTGSLAEYGSTSAASSYSSHYHNQQAEHLHPHHYHHHHHHTHHRGNNGHHGNGYHGNNGHHGNNNNGNGHHGNAARYGRMKAEPRSKSLREGKNQSQYRSGSNREYYGSAENDLGVRSRYDCRWDDDWDEGTDDDRWEMRPRLYSQPVKKTTSSESTITEASQCSFRRVRSFRITRKGLEKQDLVIKSSKESIKNAVLQKANSTSQPKRQVENKNHKIYRVSLLGSKGVGKRAMIQDFLMPDDFLEQLGFTEKCKYYV